MISIIVPTLNEEGVIGRTLSQIRDNLKKTEYEIIVSDGGSSDKTVLVAEKYADKVIRAKLGGTIAQGRNAGAKEARGEYLVFFDADTTIFDPDNLFFRLADMFDRDEELVAATTAVKVLPKEAKPLDNFIFGFLNVAIGIMNNFLGIGRAFGEFQMVRSSAFSRAGGYNEKLVAGEDHEMFYRLSKIGKVRSVNSLTIYHSGRRAHKLGWPKLLWEWSKNAFTVTFFKRSHSKNWEVIR